MEKKVEPKKSMTVRITTAVIEACEAIAAADERSLTFVVQKAMEAYVERHRAAKRSKA